MNLTNYTPRAWVEDLGSDSGRKHDTAQGLEWILTAEFGSRLLAGLGLRGLLGVSSSGCGDDVEVPDEFGFAYVLLTLRTSSSMFWSVTEFLRLCLPVVRSCCSSGSCDLSVVEGLLDDMVKQPYLERALCH